MDQAAQGGGDLGRPCRAGIHLGGTGKIAEQVLGAQLVDQGAELGRFVVLVTGSWTTTVSSAKSCRTKALKVSSDRSPSR